MVKITNGYSVFEVTRGAFDGIYSRQGFRIVKEKSTEDFNENTETPKGIDDDEVFVKEIIEKPISQWKKDEIKRFASIKEIDISETKNANEAKEIIKSFLESQE